MPAVLITPRTEISSLALERMDALRLASVSPEDFAMEFRCPYCGNTAFELMPDQLDAARCLGCGKVAKLTAAPESPETNELLGPPGQ